MDKSHLQLYTVGHCWRGCVCVRIRERSGVRKREKKASKKESEKEKKRKSVCVQWWQQTADEGHTVDSSMSFLHRPFYWTCFKLIYQDIWVQRQEVHTGIQECFRNPTGFIIYLIDLIIVTLYGICYKYTDPGVNACPVGYYKITCSMWAC